MTLNWKHVLTFAGPVLVALGNAIEAHWSVGSLVMLAAAVTGTGGALALPSVSDKANILAVAKAEAEQIVK